METGRAGRCALYFMNYNFTITHFAGHKTVFSDAISRRKYPPEPPKDIETEFEDDLMTLGELASQDMNVRERSNKTRLVEFTYPGQNKNLNVNVISDTNVINEPSTVISVELPDILPLQRNCVDTTPFFDYFEEGLLPANKKEARKLVIESEFYEIIDGRLYHIHHPRDEGINQLKPIIEQLCVPRKSRYDLVRAYHDRNQHLGRDILFAPNRNSYYWKTMFADIYNHVQSCNVCSQCKINRKRKPCPLSPIPPVGSFQRVHVDLFGPLKECQGFKYVLVCIESFSRFPECIPFRETTAEELVSAIYNSIITRYGAVASILSDLGNNLTSQVFKCLSDMMGFTHLKTSSFHQQSIALCEKWNQNIIQALRFYCTDQEIWLDYIPQLL